MRAVINTFLKTIGVLDFPVFSMGQGWGFGTAVGLERRSAPSLGPLKKTRNGVVRFRPKKWYENGKNTYFEESINLAEY